MYAKFESNSSEWSAYEANIQADRSNFYSTQSILLAAGAIVIEKKLGINCRGSNDRIVSDVVYMEQNYCCSIQNS